MLQEILKQWCFELSAFVGFLSLFFIVLIFLAVKFDRTLCHVSDVSGPGLKSATVNHPAYIILELTVPYDIPCSLLQLNVTVQLELLSNAKPVTQSVLTPTVQFVATPTIKDSFKQLFQYLMSYTPIIRGQYKLHVQVNSTEINGSPFTVTVYPDPRELGLPVRTVTNLSRPYGIVFNSQQEMIVSEYLGHQLYIKGQNTHSPDHPRGIAIDSSDNIYVSSHHKLQKSTANGELMKYIEKKGRNKGEFIDPRGIALYDNQLYVCDSGNHRIQVFDLNLNFVQSIGSHGKGRGEFDLPWDVKFDTAGNMHVAEWGNGRVQVLDTSGQFIRTIGEERVGKLSQPSSLHIADKFVYVSDWNDYCIVVYETSGKFVTSFAGRGEKEGQFYGTYGITSSADGFIHVCDFNGNRVQIF